VITQRTLSDMEDHSRNQLLVFGDTRKAFSCHVEDMMCNVKHGENFNYCPYCGQGLDW